MQTLEECHDGLLTVRISERTLVKPPNWDELASLKRDGTLLVALDFGDVEFVSSLFWQACVELNRRLTEKGQSLALLHLTPHQKQVLELVDGSSRLALVEDVEQLEDRLRMLQPRSGPDGGVSGAEKRMLWS